MKLYIPDIIPLVVWDWKCSREDGLMFKQPVDSFMLTSTSSRCVALQCYFLLNLPYGNVKDTNKPTRHTQKEMHVCVTEVNNHVSDHAFFWKILAIIRESVRGANIKLLWKKLTFSLHNNIVAFNSLRGYMV